MTLFDLFNQKPYFDTAAGKEFREKSPKAHAVAVICVLGAIAWFFVSVASTPHDSAKDARLYAISYGQMAIEKTLRDPSSVKWDFKAVNRDNGALCYSYRAKNGFGGMVAGETAIKDGKIVAFRKACPDGANYEVY